MTPDDIVELVRADLLTLRDPRVLQHVHAHLIDPPRPIRLAWSFGEDGETVDALLVLDHPPTGIGIAHCVHGFGPKNPWGMIWTHKETPPWIGQDSAWYDRFLDAYLESQIPTELPIWRVRERKPGEAPQWLSEDLSWDDAWKQVEALRRANPEAEYNCEHDAVLLTRSERSKRADGS